MDNVKDVYEILQVASWQILEALGCQPQPILPVNRTRRWSNNKSPCGVAYHYTGGPSGIKSIKWFNHQDWGNKGSSAHAVIFDRLADDLVGEIWSEIDGDAAKLFPTPTVLLADFGRGVWCTNWTNAWTVGVENRNCGYNIKPDGKYDIAQSGKKGVALYRRLWEPYTRQQIHSNINLGRLVKGLYPETFDPDWIIGHSSVWAIKTDPGPHFPLHLIRHAIVDNSNPYNLTWMEGYDDAPNMGEQQDDWEALDDIRGDETLPEIWIESADREITEQEEFVIDALNSLGFNTGPGIPSDKKYHKFVGWFQRSTSAYTQVGRQDKVLKVDGIAGPKTQDALTVRLKESKIK
jgi:hypothetical protein